LVPSPVIATSAAGLFLADQRQLVLRFGLGEEIIHARLLRDRAAVSGLSPVIITVRMPIARNLAKRSPGRPSRCP
jgi:hypothetical protein